MYKSVLVVAAISGALAVAIGAFGAHILQDLLAQNDRLDTFDTASQYHFYHTIALLIIGLLMRDSNDGILKRSAMAFVLGILIFSGSLYTLSVTNITFLGAITPIGGILFIIGWALLAIFALKKT